MIYDTGGVENWRKCLTGKYIKRSSKCKDARICRADSYKSNKTIYNQPQEWYIENIEVVDMEKAVKFLREYVDDDVTYENWQNRAEEKLSLALVGAFEYGKVQILNEEVLLMKPVGDLPVGKMQKMLENVSERCGMECVLVLADISPYMIKKLLMDKTAFVVPGKQISLPFLAMQIRSERKSERRAVRKFAPGTQLIFLYLLYKDIFGFTQEELANILRISSMTVVRGMNDLVSLGLISYEIEGKTGRKKVYHLSSKEEFYQNGKMYLDNPVRRIVYVDALPEGVPCIKGDLTALSEQTMLAEPEQNRYAIYVKNDVLLDNHTIDKDIALEKSLPQVQLIKYDIALLSENGYVDPLTLILGLNERDERIDMAIDELMERYGWYEG